MSVNSQAPVWVPEMSWLTLLKPFGFANHLCRVLEEDFFSESSGIPMENFLHEILVVLFQLAVLVTGHDVVPSRVSALSEDHHLRCEILRNHPAGCCTSRHR